MAPEWFRAPINNRLLGRLGWRDRRTDHPLMDDKKQSLLDILNEALQADVSEEIPRPRKTPSRIDLNRTMEVPLEGLRETRTWHLE